MEVKGDSDTSYPFAVIVTNSDVISLGETFELDGSPSYYRDGMVMTIGLVILSVISGRQVALTLLQ